MEYANVELHLEASRVGVFPRLRLGHEPGGQSWETGQSLMQFSVLSLLTALGPGSKKQNSCGEKHKLSR